MEKYNTIFFDLDGTLTDSKIGITKCAQYALAKFGIEIENISELEFFIGPPLKDTFLNHYKFDEKKTKKAIEFFRERFSTVGLYENEVYPGIKPLLEKLKKNNKKIFVTTSKARVFAKKIIEYFELDQYFELIIGAELDGTLDDKKDIIEYALKQVDKNIDKSKVIMVGDRIYDIEGAKSNNIASIGVSYGYGSMDEIKNANPDFIVGSVGELGEVLLLG